MGCEGPSEESPYTYKDPNSWYCVPGTCLCNDGLKPAETVASMVLESLQHLDEVLCAEVYDALVTTAKLGISAIPGGITESLGAQVGIKAAKMIFKHGLGSDTFRIWYNGFCPLGKIGNDDVLWLGADFDVPSARRS
ncbi:hypothetical protein BDV29DRAFT_152526 [Aspergillus leporis]|uniref:Uncharacterized protein n=1 Tax=Aspergillus leporis TaxID=41062 RepID=A0A5N5XGU1_9EURO|nr:hypothetical protein BDV29DRAFT_152526 [Aspergillus leporis]